ncbi:MAG: MarC family protein [Alphaproteobacteria bacterium]|jgi:membrane protein, MarC family|nr:MarC family protein [Alphaproteobacteria bacterium]MBU0792539.1 MarC family protein [Alphaproteobacteria bacterium]MBU0877096.1 MarC family protein [Alphaproteobacteria bacterium]MBU1770201.1 MarC family protein [Alphaproteobacteria bacterium]
MIELFFAAFITLFVVIDPPGTAPIFSSLTSGASAAQRRSMALRAVIVASGILLAFAVAGEPFLRTLGITLEAFRIAGGIMLFFIAMDMVFETRTRRREDRAQKIMETPEIEDVAIFPMAMPMIAGPGSIATIMLLMARASGPQETVIVFAALAANLLLMLAALLAVGPIMRLFGGQVEAVITRLLGVILAALAVQFVIDGLRESIL